MTPAYAVKLSFKVRKTDIGAQKIDGSTLNTFKMILIDFQVKDKLGRAQFFQKTFLLANISAEIVIGMLFLILSNTNVQFIKKKLTWRSYTDAQALTITKQVELINKKEFAKVVLNEKSKTFVIYVTSFNLTQGSHPDRAAQIAFLLTKKVKILDKYSDFANVFLEK